MSLRTCARLIRGRVATEVAAFNESVENFCSDLLFMNEWALKAPSVWRWVVIWVVVDGAVGDSYQKKWWWKLAIVQNLADFQQSTRSLWTTLRMQSPASRDLADLFGPTLLLDWSHLTFSGSPWPVTSAGTWLRNQTGCGTCVVKPGQLERNSCCALQWTKLYSQPQCHIACEETTPPDQLRKKILIC